MNSLADMGRFWKTLFHNRRIILEISKRDTLDRHSEEFLGTAWLYLDPLLFVLAIWFVFSIGLKSNPGNDTPFILYLLCGQTVWHFFAQTLSSMIQLISKYSFLLEKGDFNLSLLHVAKIFNNLLPHLVLIVLILCISFSYHIYPAWITFQILYYLTGFLLFLLGMGWLISSIGVFVKDIASIMRTILRFGFWLTPIFWNLSKIPEQYQWLVKLNPVCYIVTGYRDCLLYHIPFWERPYWAIYFWFITFSTLFLGAWIFNRLKPHFAEVVG